MDEGTCLWYNIAHKWQVPFCDKQIMLTASEQRTDRVAVCVTGLQRSLLQHPVTSTFHAHVIRPLSRFFDVHAHFALVVRPDVNGSHAQLARSIVAVYAPRSLVLTPLEQSEAWMTRTPSSCTVRTNRTWANPNGDRSVLAQFFAIGQAYASVEAAEASGGFRYAWLLRTRTDLAFFADVPLPGAALEPSHAYVSASGMTGDPACTL
jgi:hypothetical protein